ncbi:SpoVT/AbrB-like protein [Escherichia coli 908519]|nr:SpoVT/AbrB-like protein [Escherichia coli 908519]
MVAVLPAMPPLKTAGSVLRWIKAFFILYYAKEITMNMMNNCASPAVDVILKYNIRRCSMYTTRLKKVGGSIMLAVPPAVLKTLELSTDSEVGMTIDNGCLIIEPQKRPRYSLEELLAQCDPHAEMSEEDREWIDAPAVGKEIL